MLCKSVDELLLQRGRDEVKVDDLKAIADKAAIVVAVLQTIQQPSLIPLSGTDYMDQMTA
ncbi:hypothetical protein L195_g053056, partial [Trifolium pratense]